MKRTRHTPEQVVSKNTRAEGHECQHVLCAVTKLRILPYPKVGRPPCQARAWVPGRWRQATQK
jgi:hypothetical protein